MIFLPASCPHAVSALLAPHHSGVWASPLQPFSGLPVLQHAKLSSPSSRTFASSVQPGTGPQTKCVSGHVCSLLPAPGSMRAVWPCLGVVGPSSGPPGGRVPRVSGSAELRQSKSTGSLQKAGLAGELGGLFFWSTSCLSITSL